MNCTEPQTKGAHRVHKTLEKGAHGVHKQIGTRSAQDHKCLRFSSLHSALVFVALHHKLN